MAASCLTAENLQSPHDRPPDQGAHRQARASTATIAARRCSPAGLRDEGFEVVYTGLRQTPEMVVTAALQEDVDVVGLSILSGAHMTLVPRVTRAARASAGMDDVLVTVGGIIPDDDVAALSEAGVAAIFGPGHDDRRGRRVPAGERPTARLSVAGRRRGRGPPSWPRRRVDRRPTGAGPAPDRGREPHAGRRGGAAAPLPARRAGRTSSGSPGRRARASRRSSPR